MARHWRRRATTTATAATIATRTRQIARTIAYSCSLLGFGNPCACFMWNLMLSHHDKFGPVEENTVLFHKKFTIWQHGKVETYESMSKHLQRNMWWKRSETFFKCWETSWNIHQVLTNGYCYFSVAKNEMRGLVCHFELGVECAFEILALAHHFNSLWREMQHCVERPLGFKIFESKNL